MIGNSSYEIERILLAYEEKSEIGSVTAMPDETPSLSRFLVPTK